MKKPLLLFIFGAASLASQAQITITTADVATPTKVIYQAHDTLPAGISMGSAGPSQTWNMSALGADQMDTLTFRPYSAAPNPKFAGANIAVQSGSQPFYTYLSNTSSMLTILGNSAVVDIGTGPTPFNQVNSPAEKLANFPAAYGSNFTNNFTVKTVLYYGASGVDSIRMRSYHQKSVNVDAWGSLATPLGTFSTLRFLEVSHNWDTTEYYVSALGGWQTSSSSPLPPQYAKDSAKKYTWWANAVGFPLVDASLDYNTLAPNGISWLMAYPSTVGVNEYTAATEMNIYPNPAQDQVNIAIDPSKVSSVQVFDVTGRMIGAQQITANVTTLNTSAYANGVYSINMIGKNKEVLAKGKFTVAK